MKFLVDECAGRHIGQWLHSQGYDTIAISETTPGLPDDAVLLKAFTEDRILITADKDFGEMIFRNKHQHRGIILIRLEQEDLTTKIAAIGTLLNLYSHDLYGNFTVVTEKSIRITRLQPPEIAH